MRLIFILIVLLCWANVSAQELSKPQFSGYVRNLQNWVFTDEKNSLISGGYFHNRLIFNWQPDTTWTFDLECRNRLFYGEWVRFQPGFTNELGVDNGWLDLSFVPVKRAAMAGSVALDRAWVQFQRSNWNLRAGRQRINWGIAVTWNPNDLFNTYDFLDFDYAERPGADAVRLTWETSPNASLEAASALYEGGKNWIGGLRYVTRMGTYDLQAVGAYYRRQIMVGGGWAGNLGEAGFKGELSVFQPTEGEEETALEFTTGIDHVFGENWYLNGSFLFNSRGEKEIQSIEQIAGITLTPDRLMPTRYNFLLLTSKEITPLVSGQMTVYFSPNSSLLVVSPAFTCSIADNWVADLTAQILFLENEKGKFDNNVNALYLRVSWSY